MVVQPLGERLGCGRLSWDAHRIEGDLAYFETNADGNCSSGPIPFSVTR